MKRANGCNSALLSQLLKKAGKPVRKIASEITDTGVKVSATLLWRLESNDYDFVVGENKRGAICDYFDVDEKELFPFIAVNEEKAI